MRPALYVNIFVGQTRSAGWIRTLESYGFGEMCCRGELPPRRHPWAFDNGAFKDWDRTGAMPREAFRADAYHRDLDLLALHVRTRPDFLVVPDLPANGIKSLRFSLEWAPRLAKLAPLYLVVQDGMSEADVRPELGGFAGLFVGGTLNWKLRTAKGWIDLAHAEGKRCHLGRFGTEQRVRAAIRWGADSIDSCLPLFSEGNLRRFIRGFVPAPSRELFPGVA